MPDRTRTEFLKKPVHFLAVLLVMVALAKVAVTLGAPWFFAEAQNTLKVASLEGLILAAVLVPLAWWLVVLPLWNRAAQVARRVEAVIESSPDAVLLVDAGGLVISANPAAEAIFGCKAADIVRRPVADFQTPHAREAFEGAMRRSLDPRASATTSAARVPWKRAGGEEFAAEFKLGSLEIDGATYATVFLRDVSDAARTESALQASQARLATVLAESPVVLLQFDAAGRLAEASGKSLVEFDYLPERDLGREPAELAGRIPVASHDVTLALKGQQVTSIIEMRGRVFESRMHPRRDAAARVAGALAIVVEISDRAHVEDALRATQEYTRAIIESSLDMIIAVDTERRITEFNRAAEQAFGYSRAELISHGVQVLYADSEESRRVYDEVIRLGRCEREVRNRRKDGTEFASWLSASVVKNKDGDVIGLMGVSRDVSALRRAENERQRFFNMSLDLLCITGFDGSFRHLNPAWQQTLGYSVEEMRARPFFDFVHPADHEKTAEVSRKLVLEGSMSGFVNRYLHKDGGTRWLLWSATAHQDEGLCYAIARDITDQVLHEQLIERRAGQQEMLAELGHRALSGIPLDELINDAVAEAAAALGVDRCEVLELLPSQREMALRAAHGLPASAPSGSISISAKMAEILALGTPIVCDDPEVMRQSMPAAFQAGWRPKACVGVAIRGGALPWGLLIAHSARERTFDKFDQDFLQAVSNTLATAIDRQEAEARLGERERRYRTLFELSPSGIVVEDADGIIVDANGTLLESLGYSREELVGKSVALLASDELKPRVRENIARVLAGESLKHTVKTVRRDGSVGYFVLNESRVELEGGRPGIMVVSLDITDQILAQEALKEAEERFTQLVNNINEAFWICSPDYRQVHYVSPAFTSIWGVTAETVYGESAVVMRSVHPGDKRRFARTILAQVQQGTPATLEFRIIRPDKRERAVRVRSFPVRDEHGRIHRTVGVAEDITDRKRLDDAYRENQLKLNYIIDNTADAIFMKDPDGRYVLMNPACTALFGLPQAQLLGKDDADLFGPEVGAEVRAVDRRVIENRETVKYEGTRKFPAGERSYITIKFPYVNYRGEVVGLIGVSHDITERKRAERELIDAREAALDAARAKSDFLANMSHEVRTPLNAIIGMTGLLLETPLAGEQREFAETVRRAGEGLLSIINDILDFSKIEAGKLELEEISFSVRTVVEEALEIVSIGAQKKNIEIAADISPEVPPRTKGDPGRLRQVLLNLLSNALKFTHQGEVIVSVACQPAGNAHHCLQFEVRDTGIGIPPDRRDRLFRVFSQVDASTTRQYGGTGLGLVISQRLVNLLGGQIGFDSEVGKGSTFWFTTIMARDETPDSDRSAELEGLRVLVVDDNATNRRILRSLLRQWGCQSAEAADGNAALALLHERAGSPEAFRVAILDFQMPGMDGIQLARAIRADRRIAKVSTILLSSVPDRSGFEADIGTAIDRFLTKPAKQTLLRETIASLTGNGPAAVESDERTSARHLRELAERLRCRILVVEDNAANQLVAVKLLEKFGFRADLAGNGLEAIGAHERRRYDLIFMDCQMPELDGYEATRRIRAAEPPGCRVPIVAMTANAMKGDRERCIEAGMDDYLSKPVVPAELRKLLEKFLEPLSPDASRGQALRDSMPPSTPLFNRVPPEAPVFVPPTPPPRPTPASPIETARLRTISGGDREFERILADAFRTEMSARVPALEKAIREGNWRTARREAHSIKGAASNIGAAALGRTAGTLESLFASETAPAELPDLAPLKAQLAAVETFLTNYLR